MPVNQVKLLELASIRGFDLFEQIMDRMSPDEMMEALTDYGYLRDVAIDAPAGLTSEGMLTWLQYRNGLGDFYNTAVDVLPPLQVSGLKVWLKRDTGLYAADDGLVAVADGGTVGYWADQSGNGKHFVQATGARRPAYVGPSGSVPGYVNFVDSASTAICLSPASALNVSDISASSQTLTWMLAFRLNTLTGGRNFFGNNPSTGTFGLSIASSNLQGFIWNGTSNQSTVVKAMSAGTEYVACLHRAAAKLQLSLNGGTDAASAADPSANISATASAQAVGLPWPDGVTSLGAGFRAYDLLLFTTNLSLADRNFIGNYLAFKNNISWTDQSA